MLIHGEDPGGEPLGGFWGGGGEGLEMLTSMIPPLLQFAMISRNAMCGWHL